jgi:sugar lactone lactonase YvrE
METWGAELAVEARAELGEGPVWDARTEVLWWVDIPGRVVHRYDPATGADEVFDAGTEVGTLVPRRSGGLLCAVRDGFAVREEDGALRHVAHLHGDDPTMRMNDGKCDRLGRLWASSMAFDCSPLRGCLYRLDPDYTLTPMLAPLTIGNGMAWSADDRTMYFIDSGTGGVDAIEFDLDSGELGERRQLVSVPESLGIPDGMCIDAEGFLWVALYGGSAVLRYSPDGELAGKVEVPASNVTCATFGGPQLDLLFITTARAGLSEGELAGQPQAGALFVLEPGIKGVAPFEFAG